MAAQHLEDCQNLALESYSIFPVFENGPTVGVMVSTDESGGLEMDLPEILGWVIVYGAEEILPESQVDVELNQQSWKMQWGNLACSGRDGGPYIEASRLGDAAHYQARMQVLEETSESLEEQVVLASMGWVTSFPV